MYLNDCVKSMQTFSGGYLLLNKKEKINVQYKIESYAADNNL